MATPGEPLTGWCPLCAAAVTVLQPPLPQAVAADYAQLCKALADETRIQIVRLLAGQVQPLCVCHIESAFGLTQSGISYHLKVLREAGLVQTRRHGTWIYYHLNQERLRSLLPLLQAMPADVQHQSASGSR